MYINKFLLYLLIIISIYSCSKDTEKKSIISEKNLNLQVLETYKEGIKSLEEGDALFAAKKFNEAEILFPQSVYAPKYSLMAAYAYYSQDYYGDAIAEINRFFKIYPNHDNSDYAYYLKAISYYEQIVDEKKDLKSITNAKKNFKILINNFPDTEYALDAEFKIDLINDILASKEMYIGRYYLQKNKWIPAINRFKTVIDDYDTTIYTEEALFRLVEVYYLIGLENEAKKYAKLLGYNYKSSTWYEKSYSFFNKTYEENKRNELKKKNNFLLKKFKSLFE